MDLKPIYFLYLKGMSNAVLLVLIFVVLPIVVYKVVKPKTNPRYNKTEWNPSPNEGFFSDLD